jgi:hypothetical protein
MALVKVPLLVAQFKPDFESFLVPRTPLRRVSFLSATLYLYFPLDKIFLALLKALFYYCELIYEAAPPPLD